ncbi:hypothetical protein HAX54_051789, partial [Datura stramonium]|nr:hypothetical protein [Datura stramonium]
ARARQACGKMHGMSKARKLENILSVMLGTLGAGMGDDSRARRACALAWALACARTRQTQREKRNWHGRWHAHARGRCGGKVGPDPGFLGMLLARALYAGTWVKPVLIHCNSRLA